VCGRLCRVGRSPGAGSEVSRPDAHRLRPGYLDGVAEEIDLRKAMNAVSDVIQNRPRPLREFDQIYMKASDMVMQSEFIARWADGKRLAFIGDGDATPSVGAGWE